jgi:2-amino-4-hydroxy-6-hydroxymethyldihydropteridine diphosphokinase
MTAEPHEAAAVRGAWETAYVGLGANLDDPRRHVEAAAAELSRLPSTRLRAVSSLYRTAPLGPADQPDYVNAVARLETRLAPRALLAALQGIERDHGRVRDGTRWGPRTLDLDLLTFGEQRIVSAALTVPHPEMHRRAFVLVPLADVAPPSLPVPGRDCLAVLLAAVPLDGVSLLAPLLAPTGSEPPPAAPVSVRRHALADDGAAEDGEERPCVLS